jgi:hypothetical protein
MKRAAVSLKYLGADSARRPKQNDAADSEKP